MGRNDLICGTTVRRDECGQDDEMIHETSDRRGEERRGDGTR